MVRVVLTVEIPTLDRGGGVDYWVGGTEMFRSPQVEDRAEAEFLHKLDEHSNGWVTREAILSTNSHLALRK